MMDSFTLIKVSTVYMLLATISASLSGCTNQAKYTFVGEVYTANERQAELCEGYIRQAGGICIISPHSTLHIRMTKIQALSILEYIDHQIDQCIANSIAYRRVYKHAEAQAFASIPPLEYWTIEYNQEHQVYTFAASHEVIMTILLLPSLNSLVEIPNVDIVSTQNAINELIAVREVIAALIESDQSETIILAKRNNVEQNVWNSILSRQIEDFALLYKLDNSEAYREWLQGKD